jgi:acyl-coenzyme A thioesterase PaaI-like protein
MTDPTQQFLETVRNQAHPNCISCSSENRTGLALHFNLRNDNGVEAEFECDRLYQGYSGFLHGGISSMLLDSAMANCLFAHQIRAVTARLIVRYQFPVKTDCPVTVRAWMREYEPPLYVLEAEIEQDGKIVVRGSAKFMNQDIF